MAAERILIVDDEENMRRFLVKLLEAEGFEAAAAPDVPEALALAREGVWDSPSSTCASRAGTGSLFSGPCARRSRTSGRS